MFKKIKKDSQLTTALIIWALVIIALFALGTVLFIAWIWHPSWALFKMWITDCIVFWLTYAILPLLPYKE